MYVDNLSEEDLAKVFTDFVFCNTQVADYYGETATMDDVFYATMLDVVTVNLRRIARNHKLLAQPEAEVDAAVEAMYPSRAMEFMRYATAFSDYEARLPGADWAAPTCITVEPPKARAALLIVVAQIIVAYVIEVFGMFGVERAGFEWKKVLGALVAVAGIAIFQY